MTVGIIVALPDELITLTSLSLEKGQTAQISDTVLVIYSGAGSKNAQAAAERLIAQGVTGLISWGCAAGLAPTLKPGDLLLADSLLDHAQKPVHFNLDWQQQSKVILSATLPVQTGCLLESQQLVSSPDAKKQLHIDTHAAALDMESVAIANLAWQHQLPFLVIRAVADPVTMRLPNAVQHALNEQGDVVLSKLGWFLIAHPSELWGLIKLGLNFNAAKKTLSQVSKQLNLITAQEK